MPRRVFASRVMTRLYGRGCAGAFAPARLVSPPALVVSVDRPWPVRSGLGPLLGAGAVEHAVARRSADRAVVLFSMFGGEVMRGDGTNLQKHRGGRPTQGIDVWGRTL